MSGVLTVAHMGGGYPKTRSFLGGTHNKDHILYWGLFWGCMETLIWLVPFTADLGSGIARSLEGLELLR